MSIFRNGFHPWGVKRIKPSVESLHSQFRWNSESNPTVEPGVTGQVKWFSRHRGYGFIDMNENFDVFVHFSSIVGQGYRILEKGDRVIFDLVKGPQGYQAANVKFQTVQ